ncbi:hypothetical protein [Stappia sp. BW2]|uniref:hypothetical protein n=1 Tax=Stappia sp. BW2 TaxID=2592622 RepID=UPI001396992A|nr:hypothetical protein [Stappia sp. BW2]
MLSWPASVGISALGSRLSTPQIGPQGFRQPVFAGLGSHFLSGFFTVLFTGFVAVTSNGLVLLVFVSHGAPV